MAVPIIPSSMSGNNVNYVGIYGPIGVGKSFTANGLVEASARSGDGFVRMSLADPLRAMASAIVDVDGIYAEGRKEDPLDGLCGRSVREFLKCLGAGVRTGMGEDFLVDLLLARATAAGYHRVVVDDVRCRNEYDVLRRHGAIIVRIDDPDVEATHTEHLTETDWPSFEPDIVIESIRWMFRQVEVGSILLDAMAELGDRRMTGKPVVRTIR